jgi:hypothetical protein
VWGASARGVERIGLQGDRAPRASASDYAFLVGRHIANGWVSARDYYQAPAETCGVPFCDDLPLDAVTASPPRQSASVHPAWPAQGAVAA